MFPADCRCCEGPLERAGLMPVCGACVSRVRASALPACWRCGEAIDSGLDLEDLRFARQMAESLRCRECRMAEPAFDRAVSYGTYEDELRELIGLLKFDGVQSVARVLGDYLAETMLKLEPAEMLVVAVPLFAARQRQRGFNQSVLLADGAIRRIRRLWPEWKLTAAHGVLRRVKSTEAQFVLSRRGRRRNLRGAFAVTGDVAGRQILLVDDILTSGATARECARVLKAAGASRVWVATVARAQKQEFARLHEDPGDAIARWNA